MKLVELPCYTNEDRLEALPSLTARDLNDFCDEFRSSSLFIAAISEHADGERLGNLGADPPWATTRLVGSVLIPARLRNIA